MLGPVGKKLSAQGLKAFCHLKNCCEPWSKLPQDLCGTLRKTKHRKKRGKLCKPKLLQRSANSAVCGAARSRKYIASPVADDGSGETTAKLIGAWKAKLSRRHITSGSRSRRLLCFFWTAIASCGQTLSPPIAGWRARMVVTGNRVLLLAELTRAFKFRKTTHAPKVAWEITGLPKAKLLANNSLSIR